MATPNQSADESSGFFGRRDVAWDKLGRRERVPDTLVDQLRFAFWYPRTADFSTFLGGAALLLSSVVIVTTPLVYGYLLAVTRNAANGRPAPTFENWGRQYGQGLVALIFGLCLFLAFYLAAVMPLVAWSAVSGLHQDSASGIALLVAAYATPAIVAAYGTDRRYLHFQVRRSLTWATSLNYLVTALVVTAALVVGYLVTLASIITIVGPLLVGFYILVSIAAFVGVRYGSFDGTVLFTATELVDPITPGSVVSANEETTDPASDPEPTRQSSPREQASQQPGGRDHRSGRAQPSSGSGQENAAQSGDRSGRRPASQTAPPNQPDGRQPERGQSPDEQPPDESASDESVSTDQPTGDGPVGSEQPADERGATMPDDREPGVHYDDEVIDRDGPIRYHDGEYVTENGVEGVRVATLEPTVETDGVTAFLRAARQWSNISQNEPIATVLAVGDEDDAYIAFSDGETDLTETLHSLSTGERVSLLVDVAEALRLGRLYNRRHGHLTPDTVHVTFTDGRPQATVSEWGLRRDVGDAVGEDTVVTPYTAPEQIADDVLGETVDVYQLGALGCYVFTGRAPVETSDDEETLAEAIRDGDRYRIADDDRVPDDVTTVLDEALSTDPERRQESVRAVESALERTLD